MYEVLGIGCLILIVLVCLGACACCYGQGMLLALVTLGPPALLLASLVFTMAVPILYGRAMFHVFGRDGLRAVWMAPVVAILVLVYLDFAYLLTLGYLAWLQPYVESVVVGRELPGQVSSLLGTAVTQGAVNRLLVDGFASALPHLAVGPRILLIAGAKLLALSPFLLLARGVSTDVVGQTQPARLEYFGSHAFPDLASVLKRLTRDALWTLHMGSSVNLLTVAGPQALLLWPLAIVLFLAMLPPMVIGMAMLLLIITFHSLSLGGIWLLAMWLTYSVSLAERVVVFTRTRWVKCPHAGCHEPVPLPVYVCARCGAKHDRLLPGKYGFLRRTCECGASKMPTLYLLGKSRLPSICPHCGGELAGALFGSSVHVPIYGGSASGKTMLLTAQTVCLVDRPVATLSASFIEPATERFYRRAWKPAFDHGQAREKTVEHDPSAFLLSLRRPGGLPVSLYLYDPAGESGEQQRLLRRHGFIEYVDGIAVVIDPLSLPSFAERYARYGGPDLSATTSPSDNLEYLNTLIRQLEEFGRSHGVTGCAERVAVILTKGDIPHFEEVVGVSVRGRAAPARWRDAGAEDSHRIQAWFRENEPALYNLLQTRFRQRRFFAVSSLGHIPQERRAFEPRQVIHPLLWLLSGCRDLTHPRLRRFGRLALEVVAAGLVLAALLGPPVLIAGYLAFETLEPSWHETLDSQGPAREGLAAGSEVD